MKKWIDSSLPSARSGPVSLTSRAASLGLLFLLGCASPSPKLVKPRDRLFPDGTYRHGVSVQLLKGTFNGQPNGPTTQSFSGIFSSNPDRVQVVMLSPFGTTIMKITEDRKTGRLSVETQVESLRKAEPQMKKFFAPIRKLFVAPYPLSNGSKEFRVIKTDPDGWPLEFTLEPEAIRVELNKYDIDHLARLATITTDSSILTIKVESYDP